MANKMLPSGISVRIREDLIDGVSRVQTTLTIDPIVTLDGHRVTMADIGSIGYAKIDGGTAREEIVSWTGITDNTTTYTLTGCVWGVNFYNLENAVGNYKRHTAGAKFEIKTDMHYLTNQFRDNEDNVFTNTADMEFTANEIKLGDGTNATDKQLTAANGDATQPYVKYNETLNKWVISNNGVDSYDPEQGGSGLVAGHGIDINGGAIDVDLTELTTDTALDTTGGQLSVIVNTADGMVSDGDGIGLDVIDPNDPPVDPTDNDGKIVRCDSDGQVPVPLAPVSSNSATSKGYVDDALSDYYRDVLLNPLKYVMTSFDATYSKISDNGSALTTVATSCFASQSGAYSYSVSNDNGTYIKFNANTAGSSVDHLGLYYQSNHHIIKRDGKLKAEARIDISFSTYLTGFFGFTDTYLDPTIVSIARTTNHIGFIFKANGTTAEIYASVANGTTQTYSLISGADATVAKDYKVVRNGASAFFYIDDVLVATIETNLPSGSSSSFRPSLHANNNNGAGEGSSNLTLAVSKTSAFFFEVVAPTVTT